MSRLVIKLRKAAGVAHPACMKIAAIILILFGALSLGYGGFQYVYRDNVVDAGALQISVTKKKSVPIPPVLGVIAIAVGAGMLMMKKS